MQNPFRPFNPRISSREDMILSDRPTIICCFTTSKGFLTMLATTSATTDAYKFLKEWSGMVARMVSQTQKKENAQGKDTIIWHENPLNLLLAIEVKFSPGEDPMILVLMVSSGYRMQSTDRPAIPPAMPCLISAIIIKDKQAFGSANKRSISLNSHNEASAYQHPSQSIFLGQQLAVLPQAIVETLPFSLTKLPTIEPHASLRTDLHAYFQSPFILRVTLVEGFHVVDLKLSGLSQKLHNNNMQHPTLTLIIRYPNDTLHLATQDHLKNKVIIKCESCAQIEVVQKNTK